MAEFSSYTPRNTILATDSLFVARSGVPGRSTCQLPVVDINGNVNIGNTAVAYASAGGQTGQGLIFGSGTAIMGALWNQPINTNDLRVSLSNNAYNTGTGTWGYINSGGAAAMYETIAGAHYFRRAGTGSGGAAITWTDSLVLDASGAVSFATATTASAANLYQASSGSAILRSTSSRRYKKDIEPVAPEYADKVLDLRPVWYRSKAEADNPAHGFWGLIAEDVAEIDPRLVHWIYLDADMKAVTTARATKAVRDREGNVVVPAQPARRARVPRAGAKMVPDGVQYERLSVLLLDVVRRQGQRLAALEAAVAGLTDGAAAKLK